MYPFTWMAREKENGAAKREREREKEREERGKRGSFSLWNAVRRDERQAFSLSLSLS